MFCPTCKITDPRLICVGCTERTDLGLVINRLAADEKTVAERQWDAPNLAPKPQKPCDIGLFSDDSKQTELF